MVWKLTISSKNFQNFATNFGYLLIWDDFNTNWIYQSDSDTKRLADSQVAQAHGAC